MTTDLNKIANELDEVAYGAEIDAILKHEKKDPVWAEHLRLAAHQIRLAIIHRAIQESEKKKNSE